MQRDAFANEDTVAHLARRYHGAIHSFFARRVRDRREAEDLTQEVFKSLVRRSELQEIDNVEGYIFQIATNLLAMRARTSGRRPQLLFDDELEGVGRASDDISPERILLGKEAFARVVRALHELPERVRTVFILNRFEALSGREIAVRLGVSVSTVEKDMIRAIAHLRESLA